MHHKYYNMIKELYDGQVKSQKEWDEKNPKQKISKEDSIYCFMLDCDNFSAPSIVGFLNMPYIACRNLYDINPQLAEEVKLELDKRFDKEISIKFNLKEHLSQRFLNFPYLGVKRYLGLLNKYLSSLDNKEDCKISVALLKKASIIEKIYNKDLNKIDDMEFNKLIKILSDDKLMYFINDLDKELRGAFAKHLNDKLSLTKKELDIQKGEVKVLDGQSFDLLIHSTYFTKLIDDRYDDIGFCASLIDDKNICCWNKDAIKFAFYNIGVNDVACALCEDNYSSSDRDIFSVSQLPDFISLDLFKEKTRNEGSSGYNEINISYKHNLYPDAIVCFDTIKEEEKELANKHNLNIILIDTKHYPEMIKNYKERKIKDIKKNLL